MDTGIFSDDWRDWKRKADADKKWPNFQINFTEVHLEMREYQTSTLGGGFQGQANTVFQQETSNALSFLAASTKTYRKVVENVTTSNSSITADLIITNAKLVTILSKTNNFTALFVKANSRGPSDGPRTYYCWSCGKNWPHHSGNCPTMKKGHNIYARIRYQRGGATYQYVAVWKTVAGTKITNPLINNAIFSSC